MIQYLLGLSLKKLDDKTKYKLFKCFFKEEIVKSRIAAEKTKFSVIPPDKY